MRMTADRARGCAKARKRAGRSVCRHDRDPLVKPSGYTDGHPASFKLELFEKIFQVDRRSGSSFELRTRQITSRCRLARQNLGRLRPLGEPEATAYAGSRTVTTARQEDRQFSPRGMGRNSSPCGRADETSDSAV
jgi:hypothetical protein